MPSPAPPEILIVPDSAALFDEAARRFAAAARDAVAARGRFMVALSGGSTPKGLYQELASKHGAGGGANDALGVPWNAAHVFFGDERYVPHDDPQSNYRMAREALLEHVPIPAEQVHPMPTDASDPSAAAEEYERTLVEVFQGGREQGRGTMNPVLSTEYSVLSTLPSPPRFDLILLGMGPDGHTASLFPGSDAIHETQRLVVAPWVEKFKTFRLTLTPPVLCHARALLFLVSGAEKADTLRDVLEGPHDPARLPSQMVRPAEGRLTWLVDQAAAAKLTHTR